MTINRTLPLLEPNRRGFCGWCASDIRLAGGQLDLRRSWHPDCVTDYKLHCWSEVQTRFVRKRDGMICRGCGYDPRDPPPGLPHYLDLQLDHRVPLWKVQHLPLLERRVFYGPRNLQLLCQTCHKRKTAREAADRARWVPGRGEVYLTLPRRVTGL